MSIDVLCQHCQKNLRVKDEMAGKRGKCPLCQKMLNVPVKVVASAPTDNIEPKPETKSCPYCKQAILATSKKCKHCKQWIEPQLPVAQKMTMSNLVSGATTAMGHITKHSNTALEKMKNAVGVSLAPVTGTALGNVGSMVGKWLNKAKASQTCGKCGNKRSITEQSIKGTMFCAACTLRESNLLTDTNEEINFWQMASYREGLADFPNEAKNAGLIFIAKSRLCYIDENIRWGVPWENVQSVELDRFKMSGLRAVLASGETAIMMQNVRNTLLLKYIDNEGIEWDIRIQIHGALSIPGEEQKATEVISNINRYKPLFRKKEKSRQAETTTATPATSLSPIDAIKKLAELRDMGAITTEEFDEKKKVLLSQI